MEKIQGPWIKGTQRTSHVSKRKYLGINLSFYTIWRMICEKWEKGGVRGERELKGAPMTWWPVIGDGCKQGLSSCFTNIIMAGKTDHFPLVFSLKKEVNSGKESLSLSKEKILGSRLGSDFVFFPWRAMLDMTSWRELTDISFHSCSLPVPTSPCTFLFSFLYFGSKKRNIL